MRFLADENASDLVVERLRNSGHDVVSIVATKAGAPDRDVLDVADAEGRILVTEDRDFGEMVVRQRLGVHGLILLKLDRLSNAAEAADDVVSAHFDRLVVIEPVANSGSASASMTTPCTRANCRYPAALDAGHSEGMKNNGGPVNPDSIHSEPNSTFRSSTSCPPWPMSLPMRARNMRYELADAS